MIRNTVTTSPEETQLHLAYLAAQKAKQRTLDAVKNARAKGLSWEKIAKQLRVSRQAACKRYAHLL